MGCVKDVARARDVYFAYFWLAGVEYTEFANTNFTKLASEILRDHKM